METPSPPQQLTCGLEVDNLRALKVLGKGAMGTVFLVHDVVSDPSASSPFALKVVDKATLHSKLDADRCARWEIRVLTRLSRDPDPNPFLPHLLGSIDTNDFLAWAVPYCPGGDLNVLRHLQNDRVFSAAVIRFYLAEIVCALDHLHSMGIAYRDLKPENILLQQSGHVTLTDFDLSRSLKRMSQPIIYQPDREPKPNPNRKHQRNLTRWISVVPFAESKTGSKKARSARVSPLHRRRPSFSGGERSNSFVGTEEYISPEVVRGDGHEFAVDWWALGVLTYEMLYGTTPFKGRNRKETYRNVLMKEPEFIGKPTELTDLIGRLLEKDPTRRLGYSRGAPEIKEHVFFKGVRWDLLTDVLRPPIIPFRDDGEATEKATAGGLDIREYFQKSSSPPSIAPSPVPSPPHGCQGNDLFEEY